MTLVVIVSDCRLKKNDVKRVLKIELLRQTHSIVLILYIYYPFILLLLLFFSKFIFSTFIYDTNLELSKKRDLLFLQKEEHLRQINVLQDQLVILLTNSQKKTALDATLEFFVNNSSFLVGLSVFLITFSLINLFGKSDFEVFSNNIIKAQSETHNSYITSTTEV